MSYIFYKIFHLSFIFVLLLTLGSLWAFYSLDVNRKNKIRKYLLLFHGISILFIFIAGFGLIAKLKIPSPWPAWIYIKIGLWLLLASTPFFLRKGIQAPHKALKSRGLWWLIILLTFCAVLTATLKF